MTSNEHRAEAERLLTETMQAKVDTEDGAAVANALVALTHAVLSLGGTHRAAVQPGPCPSQAEAICLPDGQQQIYRCDLRAGHEGLHEATRWPLSGTTSWGSDEEKR